MFVDYYSLSIIHSVLLIVMTKLFSDGSTCFCTRWTNLLLGIAPTRCWSWLLHQCSNGSNCMWERFEYCLWNIIVKLHFVGLLATLKYFCKMESTFCRERFFVSHFLSCFAIYFLLLFCSSYCFENISRNNGSKKNRIDILHSFKGKNSNCLAVYGMM